MRERGLEETAAAFREFALHCRGTSPLYELLAERIAEDDELLALAAEAAPGQPRQNMLLAAAHDLLLQGVAHRAAAYYPTLGGRLAPDEGAFAAFRELCLGHSQALLTRIRTRRTQTNETGRCSYLWPAFAVAATEGGGRPLALIEFGASAGLNLAWDRYGYDYGGGLLRGDRRSPVQIRASLRGAILPPLPELPPAVAWRVGVERSPIDLHDAEARRWLEALVWPEHLERLTRLRAAVALARATPPTIVAGDGLELLPGLLAQAPEGTTRCVYHTHATYQLSPELRERLDELLLAAARERPLLRVSCEGYGAEQPQLRLTAYDQYGSSSRLLATVSGHGSWIAWHEEVATTC